MPKLTTHTFLSIYEVPDYAPPIKHLRDKSNYKSTLCKKYLANDLLEETVTQEKVKFAAVTCAKCEAARESVQATERAEIKKLMAYNSGRLAE